MYFDEKALENSIIELFEEQGYEHLLGENIHRENSDVLLRDELRLFLLSRYAGACLTDAEIERITASLVNISSPSVYETNKYIFLKIVDGFVFNRDDKTQRDIFINLIDFDEPENNIFKIVNQVEIQGKELRIPDAIVYINGLPMVVFEFKSAIKEDTTIFNAYKQLTVRYERDIAELFKYNAFVVISDGVNNKCGSFFGKYEYFYAWRKTDDGNKEVDGISSLYTMINGLFRKERLINVIKDFIYFPDASDHEVKIVCRYPQYFAAKKLFDSIKNAVRPHGNGKGGTYFGATGCGKSYTMLFLVRMIMKSKFFASPTIVLITDRTDLDDQLSDTFCESKKFIGDDTIMSVESRDMLRKQLRGRTSGGVYLTTIQKFTEDTKLLTDRSNVICISDEAHRSQLNMEQSVKVTEKGLKKSYGFAKYLHESFPNATYVGFTGTPVDATMAVFGDIVDAYTMRQSVEDGITVGIIYEGRAAKVLLDKEKAKRIEQYYDECEEKGANPNQVEESKRAVANLKAIIGDPKVLKAVADDFVTHYENRVAEGATVEGKAMIVCMDREIAYHLYDDIIELRPDWAVEKLADDIDDLPEEEKIKLKPIEKIRLVITRDKDDEKRMYSMAGSKEYRKELDRQFKLEKSNFKIAIVVDMWSTGFDVPALDTMYIDKPLQQHTLIQTISRVNRVYEGKEKGLIVDYLGIKNNMNKALAKYTGGEEESFDGIEQAVIIVKDQLELVDAMMGKFDASDYYCGTPKTQLACLNNAAEFVQQSEDFEKDYMERVKKMKLAFNLCSSSDKFAKAEKERIYFYLAIRAILYKLTKGDAPDAETMNAKVRKMLQDAITSDGVEEIFKAGKGIEHTDVDIFSEEYMNKLNALALPNTKIKLLERLLRDTINKYKKINKIKGIEFAEKLQKIVDDYNNRSKEKDLVSDVLDDVADRMSDLFKKMQEDAKASENLGIDFEEKAFYDILKAVKEKYGFEYPEEKYIPLAREIKKIVADKTKYTDCFKREDIKAEFKVALILALGEYKYPPVTNEEVFKEVFEQAENFKKHADE